MKTSTKTKTVFGFAYNETAFCCGLMEMGEMYTQKLKWGKDWNGKECWVNQYGESEWYDPENNNLDNGVATIAATNSRMKDVEVELKKRGFTPLLKWTGTHRRPVTLWFKPPKKQKLNMNKKLSTTKGGKPTAKKAKAKK